MNFQTPKFLVLATIVLLPNFCLGDDALTTGLGGLQTGLQSVNAAMTSIGANQAQMQMMQQQQMAMQQNTMQSNGYFTAFNQIIGGLSQVLSEAEMCIQGATKDTSFLKKATISARDFAATTASCANYGKIIDSGKKMILDLQATNTKLGCVINMQTKIGQIASQAKTPLDNLTKAANENWNIRDQIITIHDNIVKNLDDQLNGKEGYKAKLNALKQTSNALIPYINGPTGLGYKAEQLRRTRIKAANQWHFQILQKANECFFSDTTMPCDGSGTPIAPADCMMRSVGVQAGRDKYKAARVSSQVAALKEVMQLNAVKARNASTLANVDVKHVDNFLQYSKGSYDKMVEELVSSIQSRDFGQGVDKNALADFYRANLGSCYQKAIQDFQTGMNTEGSQYKELYNAVVDQENMLNTEATQRIELVQQQMNDFRSVFFNAYNSELPQFASDCTASADAYTSVDCLRILSATLRNGIEGTSSKVKLSNGTYFTANEGITAISVQTLATDSAGKPTTGSTKVTCRGFNECTKFLDQSLASHKGESEKQKAARTNFVTEHNKNLDTAFGGVAQIFTQATTLVGQKMAEINSILGASGVVEQLKPKTIEGETLAANEKTGIYDMPKDMKAALAGKGTYTEIDDPAKVNEAISKRMDEINEKMKEAFKMKGQCKVSAADYQKIAETLGDCSSKRFCRGDVASKVMGQLEFLFNKTFYTPKDKDSADTSLSRDYDKCISRTKSDARSDLSDARSDIMTTKSDKDGASNEQIDKLNGLRTSIEANKREDLTQCGKNALRQANNIGTSDSIRNSKFSDANAMLVKGLSDINDACADATEKNTSDIDGLDANNYNDAEVKSTCQSLKDKLNGLGTTLGSIDEAESPEPGSATKPAASKAANPITSGK